MKCIDGRVDCRVEWDDMGWEGMVNLNMNSSVQAQNFHLEYHCV